MLLKGSAKEIADFIELLQKSTNLSRNKICHGDDQLVKDTTSNCKN